MHEKVKQESLSLVLLQIVGILLGLVSAFYVAGELDPATYSLIGVYAIISNLLLVFSNTGIETQGIRTILDLQASNKVNELRRLVTTAILARCMMALVFVVPIGIYGYYMSSTKFGGGYLLLILLMPVAGVVRAVNDSVNLILKGFNKYFLSAFSMYLVSSLGRIIGLLVFIKFGLEAYFITLFIVPFFATTIGLKYLWNYLDFRNCLDFRLVRRLSKSSRPFLWSAYLSYLYTNLDQLLVSIFLRAEVLGTFTLAKNFWNISKTFIENIFDPMCQRGVRFKKDKSRLKQLYASSARVQNFMLLIICLFSLVIWRNLDMLINLVKLQKYDQLDLFIYSIIFSSFIYVLIKIKLNFVTLFLSPEMYLRISVYQAVFASFWLLVFLVFCQNLVFSYIGLTYLILYIYFAKTLPTSIVESG